MNFDETDFPILTLVKQESGGSLAPDIVEMFEKARTGSDDQKYEAALTIYTLVNGGGFEPAGTTPALYRQTQEQCYKVFRDCAGRNHGPSLYMASYCHQFGFGCPKDLLLANALRQQADRVSAPQQAPAAKRPAGPKP